MGINVLENQNHLVEILQDTGVLELILKIELFLK